MVEWLYEAGIGEARAALIEDGVIVEARIEREGSGPRLGWIGDARLVRVLPETGRALVRLPDGAEALLAPVPRGVSEGRLVRVCVTREPIPEPGNPKPAQVRPSDAEPAEPPGLLARIEGSGIPVRAMTPHQPDALEAAGWSEMLEQAETGLIPFAGGLLRLWPTPAMLLIDVDGGLPPAALAMAGARAAAAAIRRFDVTGSIGIDLPTVDKPARAAAAAAIDAGLPQPFERTAVNGFGFLQIVRRRERPSLIETLRADPALAAALALLRRAERGIGGCALAAPPSVIERLTPDWISRLERARGGAVALRADPALAISGAHVVA